MSPKLRAPSRAGSIERSARGSVFVAVAVLVVVLVVVGGLSLLTTIPRLPTAAQPPSRVAPAAAPPFTHGDLNVTAGETFVIQPTPGSHTYYQGGNITVFSGGTLIVRNVTLSFVQYVSDTGTPEQRLSHIYRFVDKSGGTVDLFNSTLTTDVQVINAWAKLNLTVDGALTAWNSTLAFPGWIDVQGASADFTLNSSAITANPAVKTLLEPLVIQGDTEYAASILVTGGAQFNALASAINDTYADNTVDNGAPAPPPLGAVDQTLGTGDNNLTPLYTPSDSANLTQDWLYPQADFQAGYVFVSYSNPNPLTNATADLVVWYDGTPYAITPVTFLRGNTGTFNFALPSTLLQTITQDGVLNYLNWTGDFGITPSLISIDFESFAGPGVAVLSTYLSLLPTPEYNIVVSGAGTTFNSIDTTLDLTWSSTPTSPTSQAAPYPWNSNKLLLTDGARGYFANATVSVPLTGVFSHSVVLPDATSEAFFYRWAQFNLSGRGGYLPIVGAQVHAYYAYSTNQADNATATALNNLATANPVIWGYVQYWDSQHGVKVYGTSNILGDASVLLASSNITGATVPDGYFLGTYHVGVVVPVTGVGSHWFNWSVSPYPEGVAQTPPAVAGPDFAPSQEFNSYFGDAGISSVSVLANGVASTHVNLGQVLGVKVVIEDLGTVPITQLEGNLYYNNTTLPSSLIASYEVKDLALTAPGQLATFTLNWTATKNVTGVNAFFQHTLGIKVDWNYNTPTLGGGNLSQTVSVTFEPTAVSVASAIVLANGVASTSVDLGQILGVHVTAEDVGNSTITGVSAQLFYNTSFFLPSALLASYSATNLHLVTPGQQANFTLNWKATENVTGLNGFFHHNLTLVLDWNLNNLWLGSGNLSQNVSLGFAPSEIAFKAFSPPPSTVDLNGQYFSTGNLEYNGSHPAEVELIATPVSGGIPLIIAATATLPGNFSMEWGNLANFLTAGTSYVLVARGEYNSRETNLTVGTVSVPPPTTSPTSFLTQKFLGLPLWVWIAIAAAAVVAIVLFLLLARRQAAGKLVECGECGALIPEDATVCPKCGAEFESDLIRCSRCASTIPADSKFCPECAAQLLGTPGEGASDPERQAYADFTEKYRAEAKRELGDNYSEGAFWDWWKRQPSYTPFSQWSLQQGQGTARAGMTAPPAGTQTTPETPSGGMPPKGGTAASMAAPVTPAAAPAAPATVPPPAPGGAGLKACPSCGKEIPAEYLVCPFCNAVTQ